MPDNKKNFQAVIVNAIGGIITGFILVLVQKFFNGGTNVNRPDLQINGSFFAFLFEIYSLASIPLRFCYFMWFMLLCFYWFGDLYQNNNYFIKRTVVRRNMRSWTFFILAIILAVNHLSMKFGTFNKFIIISNQSIYNYSMVFGLLLLIFGFYITLKGRIVINGYWGPDLYDYADNKDKLVTTGIYGKLRHPIYLGQIIMSVSTFILSNNVFMIFFPLIVIFNNVLRANKEDEFLEKKFSAEYENYEKQVRKWGI